MKTPLTEPEKAMMKEAFVEGYIAGIIDRDHGEDDPDAAWLEFLKKLLI